MNGLLQNLINALTIGSTYALVAVGFTLIFGVLRIVYLSHASVLAASAYVGYILLTRTGSVALALAGGAITGCLLGIVIERIAIRPVRGQDHLIPMVTSASVAIIIQEILRMSVASGQPISYPDTPLAAVIRLPMAGNAPYFTAAHLLIVAMATVLVVALTYIVQKTWMGRSIRAIADSEEVSSLLGVKVNAVSSRTLAIASTLAGVTGVLLALSIGAIDPQFADPLQFKALAIALFAGMGSIPGAVVGGYLLGLVESFAVAHLDTSYRDLFAYLLMIVILVIRPQGLLGRRTVQRV